MATILVTGATGFIGGYVAQRLCEQGHRVRCLVRASSNTQPLQTLGVDFIPGDLSDARSVARAVAGVEQVFHLGGLTSAFRRKTLKRTNGLGTRYVAQACAQQTTPPLLIYVSSIAAAGPAWRDRMRTEVDLPNPISNYGYSKLAGEIEIDQVADRVPATIVRPGLVFGPRDREMLPMFQCISRMRMHIVPGFRSPRLSLIHVQDLVDVLIQAAQKGKRRPGSSGSRLTGQGVYFACRREHPDYFQFGRLLQRALDRRYVTFLHISPPIPWLAGGVCQLAFQFTGKLASVNVDKIREATSASWACSGALAEREFGWRPQVSLQDQLRHTAQWYRDHKWL